LEQVKLLGASAFTNREISKTLRLPISTVKRHNLALLQAGYLHREFNQDSKVFRYSLLDKESYQQLQNSISNALDQVLEQLNGSALAQKASEPVKRKPRKAKSRSAQ
jgi:predicted transcriptional regulator